MYQVPIEEVLQRIQKIQETEKASSTPASSPVGEVCDTILSPHKGPNTSDTMPNIPNHNHPNSAVPTASNNAETSPAPVNESAETPDIWVATPPRSLRGQYTFRKIIATQAVVCCVLGFMLLLLNFLNHELYFEIIAFLENLIGK